MEENLERVFITVPCTCGSGARATGGHFVGCPRFNAISDFLQGGGPDPEKLDDAKWESSVPNVSLSDYRKILRNMHP